MCAEGRHCARRRLASPKTLAQFESFRSKDDRRLRRIVDSKEQEGAWARTVAVGVQRTALAGQNGECCLQRGHTQGRQDWQLLNVARAWTRVR